MLQLLAGAHLFSKLAGFLAPHPHGCSGSHCYEVFSCHAMQEVTLHLRTPLVPFSGAVMPTIGAYGVFQTRAERLQWLAFFLAAAAGLYTLLMVIEGIYYTSCQA